MRDKLIDPSVDVEPVFAQDTHMCPASVSLNGSCLCLVFGDKLNQQRKGEQIDRRLKEKQELERRINGSGNDLQARVVHCD